ncbi:FAD-binding oxidoreductase [Halomonas sp. 25-S5]|uniref:FAD-binding oxidoreductase n=1 Tax=Halomonas sp. 25-S5 TaxID=2994065 RepID=UPI0024688E69|nr:FAD-binding oxidoreductase [Halomonas sp. 25-S5]
METLTYRTLDGSLAALPPEEAEALAAGIRGGVITPADADYADARRVWNGMVDRHPALIARCLGSQDVRRAIDFARDHRMLVSVRGGGHHIAGNAVAEGGLVIDLSALRGVRVDPQGRTARVGAGALLGDVDHETQAFGLATPLGINSTTGVAGLCLGGGFGWLTRQYGLTIDNLLSADIVTADGQLHVVSASQEPELFWALQGGGGNFGVVTSFEFRLHPVGPQVHAGLVVYPFAQAQQVLRAWRDFSAGAPRELSVWTILRKAPPLPFLPESIHGQPVVVFALVHNGALEEGERLAARVLEFGEPVGSMLGIQPYAGFQTAFDPLLTAGARNYWKSHNFQAVSDALIDTVIRGAEALPGPECEVFIAQLGGAAGEVAVADTAYAGRDANFVMNVHGRWQDPAEDDRVREWARGVFRDTSPFATGGGYVNFLTEDEAGRVDSAYGQNYARLQEVKRQYDPDNLFRINQNIAPAVLARTA